MLGPGEDAFVAPVGVVRFGIAGQWGSFNERYGRGVPGRPAGRLEALGRELTTDTLGVRELPGLAPFERALQSLTALPDFRLSLGRTVVRSRAVTTAVPISLEATVLPRLALAVTVPYVRTHATVVLDANPSGREGNVGVNPALRAEESAARNDSLVDQLVAAADAAEQALGAGFCAANPAHRTCQLASSVRAFAGDVALVYGTAPGGGSSFVPIAGTEAQLAVEARVAGFRSLLGASGAGITIAGPVPAPSRLAQGDVQDVLQDSIFGFVLAPLRSVDRSHVGDIDLAARLLWLDTFGSDAARLAPAARTLGVRSTVVGVVRLGTGQADDPANLYDVGTGHGQTDVEVRSITDVVYGPRFWASASARYVVQLADRQFVRITDRPDLLLAPRFRHRLADRDLGDYAELELTPRAVLTDYFAVSLHYLLRRKGDDEYAGRFEVDSATTGIGAVTLDAAALGAGTGFTEHRVGFGFTFSTVRAAAEGRTRTPLELSFQHSQTTRASGGGVPKLFAQQVGLRLYVRAFGAAPTRLPPARPTDG